jgi:hypothetical protein
MGDWSLAEARFRGVAAAHPSLAADARRYVTRIERF